MVREQSATASKIVTSGAYGKLKFLIAACQHGFVSRDCMVSAIIGVVSVTSATAQQCNSVSDE